jgi:hypothetical protein
VRLLYRFQQFRLALTARPDPTAAQAARAALSAEQMRLFAGMQPSEQAHALGVLRRLQSQGETHPDLLVAALLHDAGKQRCPLRPWERALVVLVKALSPSLARRWGAPPASQPACAGWRRSFVVAEQHAEWGAEMALQAGSSPLSAALIRRHQQPAPAQSDQLEDRLLRRLQLADDMS